MTEQSFLVVGGGIAGIQASLDLADRGYSVHLVEESPSIGGKMALLDKTFPTMDCAICILAPKMVEVLRHPMIDLLTYSEVSKVEGEKGDFKVTIAKKPRYVDPSKCIGCGVCASKCPTKVLDEYQEKLSTRKAIYLPFPQSVPLVYCIDSQNCLFLTKGICKVCERFCEAGAIDFDQEEKLIELHPSGIIVATGLNVSKPQMEEYGYGRFPNVLTAMEFERTLTATGPTNGELSRPSDGKHPKSIAFVQCVGSRSLREGYPYCSSVCCMHATKEAILAKEHFQDTDITIYYTDIRANGKDFRQFINRAISEYGVKYIRGKPSEIREEPETHQLEFWYEDTLNSQIKKDSVDLLVLSTALLPSKGNKILAEKLGVEIDEYGFFVRPDPLGSPLSTTVDGIYVCGYAQGPKDIPDTIAEASGAASMVSAIPRKVRRQKR
jgi:heterodisulfide reductase subunit A